MIRLDDVVQILGLTKFFVQAGFGIEAFEGTALVDGDLLWQAVPFGAKLKVTPGRSQITLGFELEYKWRRLSGKAAY